MFSYLKINSTKGQMSKHKPVIGKYIFQHFDTKIWVPIPVYRSESSAKYVTDFKIFEKHLFCFTENCSCTSFFYKKTIFLPEHQFLNKILEIRMKFSQIFS